MMSTIKDTDLKTEQVNGEEEQKSLFQAAHKIFLLSLGFCALAMEETEALIRRLIERGEIAEQDGRKMLREVVDKRKENIQETVNGAPIASKTDIDSLNARIARLSALLDELNIREPES
jgi:polyhydroxyalkanoate synthesis regulator phasin